MLLSVVQLLLLKLKTLRITISINKGLTGLLIFALPALVLAQENDEHESEEAFKHHRVSITFGHTHVPKGAPAVTNGSSLVVPSWGLNYEYWFTHKWALGLHNDTEIATYVLKIIQGVLLKENVQ